MAQVKVYHPDIRVTLYKTIKRKSVDGNAPVSARFQGTGQTIDLTPFLGEAGSVRTSKGVREPAGGFCITLADKAYSAGGGFETLYGVIEPMDFIEIRMRHAVDATAAAGKPPVVMRGFVSNIQRNEAMGANGQPSRSVILTGQDYGKLWQQMRIVYWTGYVLGQDTLSNFKLFERFGVGFQTSMKAGDMVKEFVEKIANPYLKKLMPENTPNPTEIKVDTDQLVKHGTTSVTGAQNQEGTIYEILRTYGDVGVWNELFLEDREDGVYCVYRANPYKTVNGDKIQSEYPDVAVTDLPDSDVLALNLSRGDEDVANFYWVRSPRFELVDDVYRKQYAAAAGDKKTVNLEEYENAASKLYGTRLMDASTQQGGDDVSSFNSGEDKTTAASRSTSQVNWIDDRRRIMVEQNKDNVVLEQGVMRVRGNEKIRAGTYVKLRRGSFTAEYYVSQVSHEYIPFQGFFSTLLVERGMGFVERSKREGGPDSPYFSEMIGSQ